MAKYINHQQAKQGIESAIARRQYNNSLEGALNNRIQSTLAQRIGFDTLEKDQESIAKRLQENAKKVEAGEYVDPKEYDSLIADSESVGKRLGYYRNYIRNTSPDNADAIKNATDMSKAFLDASKAMGQQQSIFSNFKDANDYKAQMDAYKEQQRLTFEYDLNAGKKLVDAAKGTKDYDALKNEYDLAKYYQTAHGYDKLTENEDFDKKSKKAKSTWDVGETARAADFINGAWHAEAGQAVNKFVDGLIPFFNNESTEAYERYKLMDESEIATFNYLYNTKGQKEAQKYLDFIDKYGLQSEYAQKNKTKNWLTNIMRAIDSGGERIIDGILNVDDVILHAGADLVDWKGAENYFGDKLIDMEQPSNSQLSLSARQDEAGFWEGLTYDLAANAPQQLVNIGLSALMGPGVGGLAASIVLGVSEGTHAYAEALADGEDNLGRRLNYAVGMGVMEGVTNKLLDGTLKGSTATKLAEKLTSNISNAVAHTIVTYGAKGLSEGFEESLQEVLGTVLGNVTLDKNDEVWNWKQIGYSGLVGILSANIMNSPSAAANLRLPENSAKSYHDTFDLADVKGVSLDTRFGVFAENYMKQDEVVSAKVISDITNGNTESAYETINEAIKGYKYAKEYSKRELNQSGDTLSIFDDQIARLNTMNKLIGDGKFNAEAARNATMQNTSLWQIAAENNDTVAKTMLDDSLSNKKIEKNVLTDKGTMKAFYRLTGTDLSQFKTVTQKRNAVKVASDAYKAFAGSDAAKQVSEILKANNNQTDATVRSENRINAQKVLEEAYKLAASEDQQARNSGNVDGAKIAQAKMKLINHVKNDVRNGNVLSFASLDGSAAVNNARKYAEKAPKVEPKYSSMVVARDFETAKGVVGDEYTELFEKSFDETNSFNEAEKTVLNDIDSRIKSAEGGEKTELIEQRKKIKEYLDLARAKNAEVLDHRKQLGREEFNKRANRFQKTLKQYGIDLEVENGGELYYDENKNLISKEKYDELRKQGKKVSVVFQNGIHTERTIKIFDALSYGRYIRTLDLETGEIMLLRSGLDFNAREGVDFVIGHELVHEGETVNSGIVNSILNAIGNTKLDSYYEIGKRRAGKKTSAEADKHWNDLKELYIKAEMKNGDRAKADAKVTDAYMYEEIAADYMGMILAKSGNIDNLASKRGLLTNIKIAMKSLISRLKGDKLDVRAERVKELMKKLDTVVKSTYGKLAKTTEDAQKSTQSEAKTEAEETPAETEKRAENEEKMMVVGEGAETADQFDADGWWLGKDGKWRYEIADDEMRFERNGLYKNPQTLEDYIEHDKLFEAYPHLRNIRVEYVDTIGGKPTVRGNYSREQNRILLKKGMSNQQTKESLIHEIQHAVQAYEGFVGGSKTDAGYVEWFNQVFDKVKDTREYKALKTPDERWDYVDNVASLPGEEAIEKAARTFYRNNYGENEARATAERIDMSEEQRRKSPIVNNGNVYSTETIRSKFVDNLRLMGYTDTQIREKMNGEKTNGRTEEIGSGTRGRSADGKHIETNAQSIQTARNFNTRGERANQGLVHDGRVKYSLSEANSDDAYSKIYDMQIEVNDLTRKIKDFEQSSDFKAANDALSQAMRSDDWESGIKAYQEWSKKSGYDEMVKKRDSLRDELSLLRKRYNDNLKNEALTKEQEDIAKSGLTEAEYFRKQAVKKFGYTPYFYDAGYITPNGKMLNFSGEKGSHFGSRGQDHRAIGIIYADTQGTAALNRFLNGGNIRVMAETPGLDISALAEPTSEQYSTIRKFANEYSREGYFAVDFSDENGRVVGTLEYENRVNATRIINDIKHYYQTGEVREQSSIDKFRYSVTEAMDSDYLTAVENGDMETAQRMVDEAARANGYNSPMLYHGTDAFGFTTIDTSAPGGDHYSFWAASKESISATYTNYGKTRGVTSEITDDDYEVMQEEIEEAIDDEISNFRWLIDRTFSEWYFGQTGNGAIRDAFDDARHESGYGDGVYDVLEEFIADAYYQYRDVDESYDDYAEWLDNSPEAQKLIDSVLTLEGLKSKQYELDHSDLGGIYQLYANTNNMFEMDGKGAAWNNLRPDGLPDIKRSYQTRDVAKWARDNGYDGVIFRNILDSGKYGRAEACDVYAFFNPMSQVKSADPVTYDDNGNVIPLSERFNEGNEDIRYSVSPSLDSEGRLLTEAQQEFFKDSQIRVSEVDGRKNTITANGALFPVYHGTNSDEFFEFDKDTIGSANDYGWYGKGFYFAFTEEEASFYGDRVLECYLNVKKPFFFSEEMQSYDGQEGGDVNYDFAAFVLNLSDKFPEIAQNTFIEVSNKGEYKDKIKKPFTEFAQEIKAIYESDEFEVVEVEDRGEMTYQYRYSRDIDSLEAPERIKELIKEHYINSPWIANWLKEKGTLTRQECDEILDLFEKYGEDRFSDRWVIRKFNSRDFAEKNRLSAVISYMRDYKYGYFGQHMPEYFMEHYVGDSFAKELRKRSYDGVLQSRFGDEVVVFDSNQIKLTSNKNPTSNPDIRYSLSAAETDKAYLEAVKRGDMETAQQMVYEAAEAAGYADNSSWKMMHLAPNSKDDVSLFELKESGLVPDDYWDHPEWYTYSPEERESFYKVRDALQKQERWTSEGKTNYAGKPLEARIWVYRAVDKTKNAREDYFRNGDWVTPSYEYAVNEGQMNPNGYRIIKHNVSIKDLYWDGNSIAELGYDDGKHYAYADTLNNRKLLDPVTYDDFGNVIPLSKRFKKRNSDTRFSLSAEGETPQAYGNYNVYGKDIALEGALSEDVAPARKDVIPLSERFNEKNEDIRYSVSEGIETDEPSYNELKRELDQLKARNERLAHEFVKTHGKEVDRRSAMKLLNDIIEKYQGTIKAKDLLAKFEDAFAYVNTKGATVDALMEKLNDIATDIFDSAIEYDESFKEYSELLTDLRTTGITVSEQDRGGDFDDVGGWNEFRKKNFGSIKFVNDGKVMIDSKYQELATKYPEWFDDSITHPAEQAKEIANVARKLREIGMTPKDVYDGVDGQIVVNGIVGDLYSALKDADKKVTFADKAAKNIADTRLAEQMHYGAKVAEAERKAEDTHMLDEMYFRRKISEIKRRAEKREQFITEHYAENLDKFRETKHKQYQEKLLRSRVKDLAKRAVHPTRTKHIPEDMKGDVLKFLQKINWASDNIGHSKYAAEMSKLLSEAPKEFTKGKDIDGVNTFSEELLQDMGDFFSDKKVEEMSSEEMYELNVILMRMIHEINYQDKLFHSTASASTLASKAITQFNAARKERTFENAGTKLIDFIKYGAADPESFFHALGVPVLTEAYQNLAKQQDVFARTLRELTDRMKEIVNGSIPKSWREDYKEYTLVNGQKIMLTPVQRMSLYLLSKQEASRKRLLSERGGIVPTATKRDIVWKQQDADGKEKVKVSVPKTTLGKRVYLTEGDLITLEGTLTKEQIDIANKISELLNGRCAELGNEVSLAEEGYRKFIVENYFPMMVAETGKTFEQLANSAKEQIAHKPFTKDRTGTAGVPLVVDDIFNVMDRHVLGMSQYYAYDKALRDFQRVWKLRPEGKDSLNLTLDQHFGNGKSNKVSNFVQNFIKDVQGAQMQVGEETLLSEKFLSTYKAAQVAGNLSVVAKQPTAIFRAMPEFSAKGMAAMLNFATTKSDIKEMIENSGLAQLKDWGFSENTTAKSVAELYDKNATNWRGKLDDVFSYLAEQADMITWAAIWRASVADTKSLPEAIDKFNEVIRKTQVVKSAFTSSRIAEQSGFAKLAFAFKNEPLKTFNYIRSTINDVAEGREGAKKKAFAVTVATAINTAVVAAISAGFSLIRDDEEDSAELFAEKFKENVIADLVSNSTIILGDIWTAVESAMNGKDVERMDLAVFTDASQFALNFIDMFKKPESEQKNTWMKIFYDGARTVSNFTGIPIGNVIRAFKSVHGRVVELSDDPVARYNMTKIWYNVEGVDNASIRAKFRSILTEALDEGNYKAFAEINNDLRRHGFSASDIEKAVSNSARLHDAWNKGAEAFRSEVNKAIKVAPMLSSTYIMEAFKSKKTALVNDLYDAMKSGSKKATSDARNALLKHRDVDTKRVLTESDVDKLITKKIESSIKSEVKSKLADLYGTESYDAVKKKILNEYRHFEVVTPEYIDKLARSLS